MMLQFKPLHWNFTGARFEAMNPPLPSTRPDYRTILLVRLAQFGL
jgi:DNA-binding ferritin-like protein